MALSFLWESVVCATLHYSMSTSPSYSTKAKIKIVILLNDKYFKNCLFEAVYLFLVVQFICIISLHGS